MCNQNHHSFYQKQTGAAVVTALLIVAIVSAIAVSLMVQQRIDIRRTQQMLTAEQAYQFAQGGILWAIGVLKDPNLKVDIKENEDSEGEWPKILPVTELEDNVGTVSAQLFNLASRYNLNELTKANNVQSFVKTIQAQAPELSTDVLKEVAQGVSQWVVKLKESSNEDDVYRQYTPPYRAANEPFVMWSELRLIAGVTPDLYQKLLPWIAVYPVKESEVKKQDIGQRIEEIESAGLGQIDTKLETETKLKNQTPAQTDKKSGEYFLVQVDVNMQGIHMQCFALLQRVSSSGKMTVKQLWQTRAL